jgi:Acetyltransferase (GNAT) domain
MKRCRFWPFPIAQWLELDKTAAAPTFFARPAWAIAIGHVFQHLEPCPLACELDNGVVAIIPLSRARSRLGWKVYHGMPFDGYTAVVTSGGPLDNQTAGMVVNRVLHAGDEVMLNLWPFQLPTQINASVHVAAETSALNIGSSVETARSAIASKSRRMAGQAERKGATCSIERGNDAVAIYYSLLREAASERWHRSAPTIREDLLSEVVSLGGEAAEIWVVRYEGQPVSGGVALYGNKEVSLWTTATKPGMEILRPHNLLHATIMEHAGRRGLDWYNLNSSSGLEGVLRFKHALGAKSYPYEIVGRQSLRLRIVKALRKLGKRGAA